MRSLAAPAEAVTCTLDRNPKGMAITEERAYYAAMEDEFCDGEFYEILETEEEKRKALQELRRSERRYRSGWIKGRVRTLADEDALGAED